MENKELINIKYVEDTHSIETCEARQLAHKILEESNLKGEEFYKEEDRITELLNKMARKKELPNKVVIDEYEINGRTEDKLVEFMNDYLLNKYDYYNNGYSYSVKIVIENIEWDLEE